MAAIRRACPSCGAGRLSLKTGKFGAFIGCSNYPECRFTRQFSQGGEEPGEAAKPEGKLLGADPETGEPVTLRIGRFGPYLQLGEGSDDEKPPRASIPKGWDANTLDLERALQLLSLPREVGMHPETGKPIMAGIGRYGPFVLHDGTYANLESVEEVFTVGINRAVTVIADKKAGKGGRFGRAAPRQVLKDLGEHPAEGGKIEVLNGRYGPYVTHNKINANVPRGRDPASLSVDEAVALLAERAAKGPSKGRTRAAQSETQPRPTRPNRQRRAPKSQPKWPPNGQSQKPARRPGTLRNRTTGSPVASNRKASPKAAARALPSKDEVLAFIRGAKGKVGNREIARAFGLKGSDRIEMKRLLREMTDEGKLLGNRKALKQPGHLPPVAVMEVVARDDEGELIAEPVVWETEDGPRPRALILTSADRKRTSDLALSIGDRILARVSRLGTPDVFGYRYECSPIKKLPREKRRQLGIFRAHAHGGGMIEPVDRRELKAWPVRAGNDGSAGNGDLVRFDILRAHRQGVPEARIVEALGNPDDQRQISLIAVHAHGLRDEFPAAGLARACRPACARSRQAHRPARPAASDHRSRRCARPR